MPWKIAKRNDKYCVVKESDGSTVHCHDTEAEATAQLRALYASERRASSSRKSLDGGRCACGGRCEPISPGGTCSCMECGDAELLALDGFEAKAFGGDDGGRFGGYLARWGDANLTDASAARDFFTPATDLGRFVKSGEIDLLFHHGLPTVKGKANAFGDDPIGTARVVPDSEGLWLSGRLDLKANGVGPIWDALKSDDDAFGLSSGAVSHMVRRVRQPNASNWLKRWWIVEASITPDPAERRTAAVAVKSLESPYSHAGDGTTTLHESNPGGADSEVASPPPSLVDRSRRLVADTREVLGLFAKALDQRKADGRDLSDDKRDAWAALLDEQESFIKAAREAMVPAVPDFDPDEFRAVMDRARLVLRRSQPPR